MSCLVVRREAYGRYLSVARCDMISNCFRFLRRSKWHTLPYAQSHRLLASSRASVASSAFTASLADGRFCGASGRWGSGPRSLGACATTSSPSGGHASTVGTP